MIGEIRTSVVAGSDRMRMPAGASHRMDYGDRMYVRLVSTQSWRVLADMELTNVADMSEIYGELRYHTRGERGLTRLYVRNATKGWSFEQPFKLYGSPKPAQSVSHPLRQPARQTAPRQSEGREIPESVRMLYSL